MKKKIIIGFLRLLALLPMGALYVVSDFLYFIIYRLIRYRTGVVRRNLEEAFPCRNIKDLKKIEREYYHFMCDTIVETVKLLHISDDEMSRRVKVENPESVNNSVAKGNSVVILLAHYGNWEWVQEIERYFTDGAYKTSIYHPLKNKTWDEVYKEIRRRWKIHIVPQRNAVRTLLDKSNRPWICGFIADNRPDTIGEDNRVAFLNHNTSFIYGPELIGEKVGADFFFMEMERLKRGYYRIKFHPLQTGNKKVPYPHIREFWHEFEKVVERNPAYWLWSHKRWKRDTIIRELESC